MALAALVWLLAPIPTSAHELPSDSSSAAVAPVLGPLGDPDSIQQRAASVIEGSVVHLDARPAVGVVVDLFTAVSNEARRTYLTTLTTELNGRYRFDVEPGCYAIVLIAPEGATFANDYRYHQERVCVASGTTAVSPIGLLRTTTAPISMPAPAPGGHPGTVATQPNTSLSPVEQEIVRLTNALRADPSGSLRRQGPAPACVTESYFAITVDPETDHPVSVPALALDEAISADVARSWALHMQQNESFGHRPSSAQLDIYAQLGVEPTAWGENIAWFSGFSAEQPLGFISKDGGNPIPVTIARCSPSASPVSVLVKCG